MNIQGLFKEWEFNKHRISYNKNEYCLWVSGGFAFFEDYDDDCEKLFLIGTSFFLRWAIWKEYKKELRRRTIKAIEDLITNLH